MIIYKETFDGIYVFNGSFIFTCSSFCCLLMTGILHAVVVLLCCFTYDGLVVGCCLCIVLSFICFVCIVWLFDGGEVFGLWCVVVLIL